MTNTPTPEIDLTRYVATVNVPGYSPMSDESAVFETADEAWRYLAEERSRGLDESGEDDDEAFAMLRHLAGDDQYPSRPNGMASMVDAITLCGSVYGSTPGYDLGLAYSVTQSDELSALAQHVMTGWLTALLWANAICGDETCEDYAQSGECSHTLEAHNAYAPVSLSDFSDDAGEIAQRIVFDFVASNEEDFRSYLSARSSLGSESTVAQHFGHDLLLTQSGHGAGFWDRGIGTLGDRLTEASKPYGSVYAVIPADDAAPVEILEG